MTSIHPTAVPVRATGSERPLFLVHDGTGSVAYARALHPHLDAEIPVYALPAPDASEPQLRTVEGMATRLARMILEVQPRGPYRLAGWSFGGMLAYETATQLIGLDQAVELVGMMDTPFLFGVRAAEDARNERALVLHGLRMAVSEDGASASPAPGDASGDEAGPADDGDLEALVAGWREKGLVSADTTVEHAREIRDRLRAHRAALREYFPQPIPIPVHLFSAQESPAADPRRGWQALLPDAVLKVTPVPGTHLSMVGAENVRALGEALSREIRGVPARRRATPEEGYSPLLTLRFGKPGHAPLFCVPGAGASISGFNDLVSHLDASWPVHGLQPRGMDGDMVPYSSVQTAAEAYLREVARAQPDGPVHLLGHSFGGWVVFEMARRLRAAGRAVGSLTVLDTQVPDEDPAWIDEHDNLDACLDLVEVFEQLAGKPMGIAPQALEPLDQDGRLAVLHEALVRNGMMHPRTQPEVILGPVRTFASCVRTTYHPGEPYPDPLRLVLVRDDAIREEENQRQFAQAARGWRRWAPAMALTIGEGNHMTALKPPHVRSLAACIAAEREAGARR
jgi:thioesterase domain-containing protein